MKNQIIILLLALVTLSCTKKADIDLPEAKEKLVVTCFITPDDSVITAVVKTSVPKFGTQVAGGDPSDITNALVKLSDGNTTVTLPFNDELGSYRINATQMPVLGGKTYYLEVSTPDGKKVSASTTVPEGKFSVESASFPMIRQDSTSFEHDIRIVVPDIEGQNYFGLFFTNTVITKWRNLPGQPPPVNSNTWSHFDTDEKTAKTKFYHTTINSYFSSDTIRAAWLDVSVMNCSRDFYLYSKGISSGAGVNNPFSDPVMVYTNVTDGFGCFGSYRIYTFSHDIR